MKKISHLIMLAAVTFLLASSCRKEQNGITITKVVNVTINANDTYTYDVPHAGDVDDVMQISKQADHYLASDITPASGGNVVFKYTPVLNYVGTDEVVINNVEGNHGNGGHGGHGNCQGGKHHDDTIVYDFKITINGTTTRSGK